MTFTTLYSYIGTYLAVRKAIVDKFISVANRWAKNCGDCSVSQTEIDNFLNTEKGEELIYISNLSGYIYTQNGVWLLQQNGFQIIL